MGQKVNPKGFRVGVIKDWDSKWYADKEEFSDLLVEDYNIRKVAVSYTHLTLPTTPYV